MENNNKQSNKKNAPPNLLRGILISVISITLSILTATWLIIDYQVEQLVIKRTSEYAHSIARVAADSSAEALLSEDILQLNLLVENVAKDPYIRQATIFSEDGQIVSQFPDDDEIKTPSKNLSEALIASEIEGTSKNKNISDQSENNQFLERKKNIPFIEKIAYRNMTAGWFELEIDSTLLEQNFRETFVQIQLMTGGVALLFFIILVFIIFRFEISIRQLAESCQHLLIQNKVKPPQNKSSWLKSLKLLSESQQQNLVENVALPEKSDLWTHSKMLNQTLVCYLEFDISGLKSNHLAGSLTIAESYLNQSIQAFGVQSQGNILTGCLIPFPSSRVNSDNHDTLNEAICFVLLLQKLLKSFDQEIAIKAGIIQTDILQLEDQQEMTTGIALLGKSQQILKQLLLNAPYDCIITHAISEQQLANYAEVSRLIQDDMEQKNSFCLSHLHVEISQQIARKFSYISNN